MASARADPAPELLTVPFRRAWLLGLLAVGLLLCGVSAVWQVAKGRGWQPASLQLNRVLNVDDDLALINWLTASTFLLAALVVLVVASAVGRRYLPAAGVLVFISADEAVGLHDPLQVAAERLLSAGGLWAAALLVVAVAVVLLTARHLSRLPRPVAWRLTLLLALLAVAAVGVDAVGPDLTDDPGRRLDTWYVVKATVEEALELVAAVVALDAALLASRCERVVVSPTIAIPPSPAPGEVPS